MISKIIKICIAVLILGIGIDAACTVNEWEIIKETEDGTIVFEREVTGSAIHELKLVCVINASPDQVFRTLSNPETYKDLAQYSEFKSIIKTENDNIWYVYRRLTFPVISKRDYALRYERIIDKKNNIYRLSWNIANEKAPPEQKGVIRLKICKGSYEVKPYEKDDKALLTYLIYTDPDGNIPDWIVNIGNKYTLPDLIKAIRKHSLLLKAKENE